MLQRDELGKRMGKSLQLQSFCIQLFQIFQQNDILRYLSEFVLADIQLFQVLHGKDFWW